MIRVSNHYTGLVQIIIARWTYLKLVNMERTLTQASGIHIPLLILSNTATTDNEPEPNADQET